LVQHQRFAAANHNTITSRKLAEVTSKVTSARQGVMVSSLYDRRHDTASMSREVRRSPFDNPTGPLRWAQSPTFLIDPLAP